MKKLQLFAFVMLLMSAFGAKAALNSTESAMVGSWENAQEEKIDLGDGMSMEMTGAMFVTYNEDRTGKVEGAIRFSIPITQDGYSNTFFEDVAVSGTFKWSVDEKDYVLTQVVTDMNVIGDDVKAENNDAMAQQVIPMFKQAFDQMTAAIKESMKQGSKDEVLSVNVNEMSLKAVGDPKAEIEIYRRIE